MDSKADEELQEVVNEISEKCLYRKKQIETLVKLLGTCPDTCTSSMFIYGNTGTGKTFIIKSILEWLKLPHSFINCIESYTSKLIYHKILNDAGCSLIKACTTMMDFCRYLRQSPTCADGQTFFIIFDKADRLRKMDAHLLSAFLRLSELTSLNICTVFISEIIFEKFFTTTGIFDPVKIHFSDYSKTDLVSIMVLDCPEDYSKEFYSRYCQILVDVFFMVCRNLNELRHLAVINFSKYIEPITEGEVEEKEVRKLWQRIVPHLRKALQSVYLREVSSVQWEMMQQSQIQAEKNKAQVELPYYSKYLLLAAFFASYNPANTDRRFFAKRSLGKMSKRAKSSFKTAKNADKKFLGPKPFQIDRLMAIFYSIVEGGASSSANILSQLSSLVTLNLLTKTSADDQIDTPKYKCIVPLEFVVEVGKQVDMDIIQYLHDYA